MRECKADTRERKGEEGEKKRDRERKRERARKRENIPEGGSWKDAGATRANHSVVSLDRERDVLVESITGSLSYG